jgi:5-hydroxyisourate hydrolase
MTGAGISTHVLDTTRGAPAAGVAVTLLRREGPELVEVGSGVTGEDGRIAELVPGGVVPGWYELVFDLDPYYGSQQHFFSRVTLDIAIAEARHHHVPLLVSPYSATSYRGS